MPRDLQGEGALIRRMHRARVRQWVLAGTSVIVTALGVYFLSPDSIGTNVYYTIIALLLLNAIFALQQGILVIFPIETLLRKIRQIEYDVDHGNLDATHLSVHSNDIFACLTAGLDDLISKMSEKMRISSERAVLNAAMLQATPFMIFTVSKSGRVYSIIRDMFNLVALLGIEVGKLPRSDKMGHENLTKMLDEIAKCFDGCDFRWFDLNIGSHNLRGSVKRLNDMTALVVLGDMPAIDKIVENATGATNVNDFSHRQDMLKRFAASIAHDGKNIFAALKNLVEVNKSSSDPAVREQIPIVEDAINRGSGLMAELTTFAGEARLQLVCKPAAESISAIVNNLTIKTLVPQNVQVITDISETGMPEIDIDDDQAWKVGLNLVKNAIEAFNGNGGRIWVKTEAFKMSNDAADDFKHTETLRTGPGVLITFADDGPGIPPNMIGRIFEPYYSSKGEHRGLGLATVVSIVNAHGGAIRVESSHSKGTAFSIFLPASRNTQKELEMMMEIAPGGEILLVDDDPMILHTTSLILRMIKIAAHPASTENDAMTKLRSLRSRLKMIMVGANLHGVCSIGLVRQMHEEFPKVPIAIVSGAPKETIDKMFANSPVSGFLSKPYSIDELSNLISTIVPKT